MRCKTVVFLAAAVLAIQPAAAKEVLWRFNSLTRIGGMAPKLEGKPALIESPLGKAIAFNGKNDAIFLPGRPLVGARTFTIEAVFRPDGGAVEQRWLHIAETDPATGRDTEGRDGAPVSTDRNPRFLFEIRVNGANWYLDAFFNSKSGRSQALMFPGKLHPLGRWYAVAQTYDGRIYRSYVNGVLQGQAEVPGFVPQGPGHTMVGTRMNRVNYFHGAVAEARFTDRALAPSEFLKVPAR